MHDNLIAIELDDYERELLRRGLIHWEGPADIDDKTALVVGFSDREDFLEQLNRLIEAVKRGQPLTEQDWTRVQVATEINFVSDVLGTGDVWETVTGLDDAESIWVLRGLQRKIVHAIVKWREDHGIPW